VTCQQHILVTVRSYFKNMLALVSIFFFKTNKIKPLAILFHKYREMQKVFSHCKSLGYILFKVTFFPKNYTEINSFRSTKAKAVMEVVFCGYFKNILKHILDIHDLSTDLYCLSSKACF
jgi:hypothetical protein